LSDVSVHKKMDSESKLAFTAYLQGDYDQGLSLLKKIAPRIQSEEEKDYISFLNVAHHILFLLKKKQDHDSHKAAKHVIDDTSLLKGCLSLLKDIETSSWTVIHSTFQIFYDVWSDETLGQKQYSTHNRKIMEIGIEILEQQLWDERELVEKDIEALVYLVSVLTFICKHDAKICSFALKKGLLSFSFQLLSKYVYELLLNRFVILIATMFQHQSNLSREKLAQMEGDAEMLMEAIETVQLLTDSDHYKKGDPATIEAVIKVTEELFQALKGLYSDEEEEVLDSDEKLECSVCKNPDATHLCGQCRKVPYCSVECQKQDWPQHKLVCVPKKKLAPGEVENELVSNIVGFLLLIILGYIIYITRGSEPIHPDAKAEL
jgi:hypothetical protein